MGKAIMWSGLAEGRQVSDSRAGVPLAWVLGCRGIGGCRGLELQVLDRQLSLALEADTDTDADGIGWDVKQRHGLRLPIQPILYRAAIVGQALAMVLRNAKPQLPFAVGIDCGQQRPTRRTRRLL